MGRMAFPDTPPYVVFCSLPIDGHPDPLPRTPIKPKQISNLILQLC